MPSLFESPNLHPGLDSELDAIYAGIEDPEDSMSGLSAVVNEQVAASLPDTHLSEESKALRDRLFEPQLEAATEAFNTVSEDLGLSPHPEATIETLREEFNDWLTDEKLDYVQSQMEQDPELEFTLVATPNVLVDYSKIFAAAEAFGERLQKPVWIYDKKSDGKLYSQYYPHELSGTDPTNDNTAMFSLMPSKTNTEFKSKKAIEMRNILPELQADCPDLKVPSVLEAVAYWNTLMAQGKEEHIDTKVSRGCLITHFNIGVKNLYSASIGPATFFLGSEPSLAAYNIEVADEARLSVG